MTRELPSKRAEEADAERIGGERRVEIGQWYWYIPEPKKKPRRRSGEDEYEDEDEDAEPEYETEEEAEARRWLGCVTGIGSNFVEVEGVFKRTVRIHNNEFTKRTRFEPDAHAIIAQNIDENRQEVNRLLQEVKETTARLGMSPRVAIEQHSQSQGYALATLSSQQDPKEYKNALIQAKEKDLPALFKEIENANFRLSKWMGAELIPLQAQAGGLDEIVDDIKGRIFTVTLYAGLTEEVVQIADGEPADYGEKLRLMQRRLYMDEECLLDYRHGGMEFSRIEAFDEWLAKPKNRDRILPFARCMVAMRVRRAEKARSWGGSLKRLFINFELKELDKLTFLFIRNGDRIYRMNCDLEFGALIFPSKDEMNLSEPMMVKDATRDEPEFMSVREYDVRVAEREEKIRLRDKWFEDNPQEQWIAAAQQKDREKGRTEEQIERRDWEWVYEHENPYRSLYDQIYPESWTLFTPDFLYYDECVKALKKKIDQYNRIATIIQGLYDRSEVLHPHPPVKTWTPDGFAAAIELIYDGSQLLAAGPPPDFEEYRQRCNESANVDSVFIGQAAAWLRHEQEKEAERRGEVHDWWRPYDNPGPGYIAKPASWAPRAKKATFEWYRDRKDWRRYGEKIKTKFVASLDDLFNVSAYKPGDYLRFFEDPRTRAEYLEWAPMLLTAEEYYAGNIKAQEPLQDEPEWNIRKRKPEPESDDDEAIEETEDDDDAD